MSNVVDAIEPSIPGVRIDVVVSAADQLIVENTTATPIEVLADDGQPFLRIGAGMVEANVASPAWFESNSPTGTAKVPPSVQPGAAPHWLKVASSPSWGWFDHRLHRQVVDAAPRRAGMIETWEISMRYGDQDIAVRGHREYARPKGRFFTSVEVVPRDFITAQVVDGPVPALLMRVEPPHAVTILGEGGKGEVAVVGPDGTHVNDASPIWRITAGARGDVPDGPVGADEPPRFERETDQPQLTWLDPRAQHAEKVVAKAIEDAGERIVLERWKVPIRIDGTEAAAIEGTIEWVPIKARAAAPGDRSSRPPLFAIGGVVAVLVALAIIFRRRATP